MLEFIVPYAMKTLKNFDSKFVYASVEFTYFAELNFLILSTMILGTKNHSEIKRCVKLRILVCFLSFWGLQMSHSPNSFNVVDSAEKVLV